MNTEEKELEITVEEFIKLVPECCPHCVEADFDDLVMLPLVYEDAKLEDVVKKIKEDFSTIRLVSEYMGATVFHDADGNVVETDFSGLTSHGWSCSECEAEFENYEPKNK